MAHKGAVLGLAALAFATWAVYLGGLAAVQKSNPGKNNYRFEWWIFSYEFFIIALLGVATAAGHLRSLRAAFAGLFAVGAVYYSIFSDTYLQMVFDYNANVVPYSKARLQTMTAGLIMTAVANFLIVIAAGHDDGEPADRPAAPAKDAAAV